MIESGEVAEIKGDKALIYLQRGGDCKRCGICALNKEGKPTIRVSNGVGAKLGDRVEVLIPEGLISKLGFFVFIFPLIIFLLSYGILWQLTGREITGAIGGGIAFLLSFYGLWLYNKKLTQIKRETLPYILRIVESKK